MKRFQKIFAFILTACMLCGMIVTLAFADSEPGYVHPTLTNAAATNIANNNLESYTVGNSLTSFSGLSATRYANSSLTVGSETVDGAGNKFWKVSAPTDELNVMYTGSNRTNQRSSYFQFKPNSAYAKPNYYIGVYDKNRTDAVTPVVNNFDYLTIDYDFSAQGARVEYVDGTYGRANALTNGDDGSVTVTLEGGTVVSTNAAKNETTVTATDGTVTVWTTDGSTVTETVTASDSSKVVSVTVVAEDGSAEKTVTSYDAEGAVISTSKVTRSAVVNGGYTIIYDSGRSIVYATSTVVIDAKTGESTTTETYTVTEGENVTVYTYTNYRSSSATAFTQTLTYVKTVNGVEEYSNVSSFPYNSGSASHTNKAIITVYNAEVEALADEFSVTDLYGMHIKDTRIAYGETSLYNTFRWYKIVDGAYSLGTSTNNFYYVHYNSSLGTWGIYRDSKTEETYRIATLPDEIGVWNHVTIAIEVNNESFYNTEVHFILNGELLDTYKLSEKVKSGYEFMSIEDWRINISDVLPNGDENFYSVGYDNVTMNVYLPTVTYGEDGNVTERVPYSSGDGVYGIDDFLSQTTVSGNLADCKDVIYDPSYMLPYDGAYTVVGGEKYYVPAYAVEAVNRNVKNGEVVETGLNLIGLTIPVGDRGYEIVCPDYVVCSLSEAAEVYATLEKTDTGYKIYRTYIFTDDYRYSSGNDKSYGGSGAGSAGTYSTLKSVTYNGNAYTQYAYLKAAPSARYRYDFALGGYKSGTKATDTNPEVPADFTVGYQAREHSYFTVDFDIFADKYVYTDANGEQVLTDTIPEGVTDYKLAYANGMNIALDIRNRDKETSTQYGGGAFPHTIKLNYIDGDWHIINNNTDTGLVLSDKLYEVNHISYLCKSTVAADGSKVSVETRLYINGEFVATKTNTAYDYTIRAIDWYNTDANDATKLAQKYSVGLDNLTVNYYPLGYTSGDMKGIDDLFADGKTAYTFDYDGLVYNAEYPLDPSVNGYIQINGGEKIFNSVLARKAIEAAPAGAVITSTRSFTDIVPSASFTFVSPNGSELAIAEAALESFIAIKDVTDGVTTYTVREPSENDAITLEWYDALGNLLATDTLLPSVDPDASNKNATIVDLASATAKIVAGWYWDLDGEGTAYSEAPIAPFGAKDIPVIGGTTVKVYPKMQDVAITSDLVYVAYYNDNGIIRLSDINANHFYDISKIGDTVNVAPDGTVIMFMLDDDNIVLPKDTFYQYEGKSITFDLNGKTITRYNNEPYGAALIRVGEGGTAIVTSSVPGARVFLASKRNSTEEGNGNNRIFGADGIVSTKSKVDRAHVEISNLEFNGGTMVKFDGRIDADVAPAWENDVSITCKIDNVTAYAPNRSSYAIIATLCPDVVVEVTNSKFYVPDATYSFIHDYANDSKNGNYYRSETDLTIKNSEILCYTEGETPKMGKFWYTMGIESSLYVENTKIVANLNGVSAARAHWGAGVEIATDKTSYFSANNVDEGVKYLINNGETDAEISLSFTRSAFTTAWSYIDETNGKYIDTAYTDTVSITRSAPITFVTFTEDKFPDYVGKVEWQDQNGAVIGTDYGLVGLTATAPKSMSDLGIENVVYDWYSTVYNWGDTVSGDTVIKEGENIFIPIASESVHINGKKANISLTTGMIFNLYIPLPGEGVQEDSVSSPDVISPIEKTKVNGTDMLKLSFASELEEFAPNVITIYFVTTDGETLSYDVEIDELKYVTLLANSVECGSEEAQLAYEIIAYKKAVASYLASAEGKTLEEVLTESELSEIAAFESVFTNHASGCVCTSGLYSEDAVGSTEMPTSTYVAVGISGFAYLLQSDENGLRINMSGDVESTIKHVSYKDLLGIERVHDAALDNLNFVETESGGYYVVSGINASDITAAFTITLDVSGTEKTVTYSLAQYINSTDADVAKALYSYSMAARAYKAITESEQ